VVLFVQLPKGAMKGAVFCPALKPFFMCALVGVLELLVKTRVSIAVPIVVVRPG
jgi:hypothetical protein